jgi:diacylglycerol O-acyltransferase
MVPSFYERLSALDQSFLAFETPNAPMHVALTAIFDAGPLATADGGIDIDRIRQHVAARLRLIPRYRQRLAYVPVTGDPIWVDDHAFALGYHVRHASLPRPGGDRQLQRRCAEILERPLDRRRPLWEVWIIEGLSGGRFAMLAKVHHCMVDGIAGVDILAALLTPYADETREPIEPWTPRPMPTDRALLRDEVRRRAAASASALRGALRDPAAIGRDLATRTAALARLVRHLGEAPATPFNQPIGPHRRIDWWSVDLPAIKAIRTRFGGTLNDVVLSTVAGAVGRFLDRRGIALDGEFRAVVPVSVRAVDEIGVPGNRVSMWLPTLPVRMADPIERLRAVSAATAELKSANAELGAEVIVQAAEWTTSNVVKLAAQFINAARRFNLIVTNVPGPPVPLYVLGAPMIAAYPHLPLFENQGLGIALFSYAGRLYWGVGADWNQMPDLGELMTDLATAFAALADAAAAGAPHVVGTEPRPRRARVLVHPRRGLTPSTAAGAARGTGAGRRASSAAGGRRTGAPGPRLGTARGRRSTTPPAGSR